MVCWVGKIAGQTELGLGLGGWHPELMQVGSGVSLMKYVLVLCSLFPLGLREWGEKKRGPEETEGVMGTHPKGAAGSYCLRLLPYHVHSCIPLIWSLCSFLNSSSCLLLNSCGT